MNDIPFNVHNDVPIIEHVDIIENSNVNNNIVNISTTYENEQFSHITSDHNKQFNSMGFEGVVLVPHETNATIINDQLQGLCNLEETNSQASSTKLYL